MLRRDHIFIFLLLCLGWSAAVRAGLGDAYGLGERYAVIVGGPGGLEEYTDKYFSQTSRMYDLLVNRLGYDRDKVWYLFERTDYDSVNIRYQATADNVRRVFGELAQRLQKEDQLFVFLVGHGSFDGVWSRFNLVGPDLRDIDFARLLSSLPTQKIVLVNTASASGPFIERLSAPERVIITATKSGLQHYETNFADFFLDALTSETCDFNKDNRVSMREAFKCARTEQDRWFEEQRRIRAEHPLLDDNGDGRGTQNVEEGPDGTWAARVYLNPVSEELKRSLVNVQAGTQSRADSLRLQKAALEEQIQDLKARKAQLTPTEYAAQLETLLIRLARVNQELKKEAQP